MREIVLDTETTGLNPRDGHRILEIACLELVHQVPTGKTFYTLIDPQRDVPEEAARIHGITADKLAGQPRFKDMVDAFLMVEHEFDAIALRYSDAHIAFPLRSLTYAN